MTRLYDVYFDLEAPASITVEGRSRNDAIKKVEKMDKEELVNRIRDALAFGIHTKRVDIIDSDYCD